MKIHATFARLISGASFIFLSVFFLSMSAPASALAMTVQHKLVRTLGTKTQVKMDVDVANDPSAHAKLDILFVIDDSGSMTSHQQNLLKNVDALVKAARSSGLDLQAGVISSSMEPSWGASAPGVAFKGELEGVTKKFASTDDGDFESVLAANLKTAMHTMGDAIETPFAAILAATSEPMLSGPNKGFFRDDAALAIFILTDADDQSSMSPEDFVKSIRAFKAGAPVTLHAGYIPVGDATCDRSGEPEPLRLEAVLDAFGTKASSLNLCESFESKLNTIGESYVKVGVSEVVLPLEPQLSTVKAIFGKTELVPGDLRYGWVYDAKKKALVFGEKINWFSEAPGTPLQIEYYAK